MLCLKIVFYGDFMDNLNKNNPDSSNKNDPLYLDDGAPIPFGDDEPIQLDDTDTAISHSPLDLNSTAKTKKQEITYTGTTASPTTSAEKVISSERITGVKTFYTKLHAGAITFLDGQIINWLNENPGIQIKRTNTICGDIVAKKTEPCLIISVWY